MAQEYEYELEQGESFYREFVLRDEAGEFEDLTDATVSIKTSDGIISSEIAVTKTGNPGSIDLFAPSTTTEVWPVGVYDVHLHITWFPVVTVDVEHIATIRMTVREAVGGALAPDGGIQGGFADTDFTALVDGGMA